MDKFKNLDRISSPGGFDSYWKWANGLHDTITYGNDSCTYIFRGRAVACGIVAWWLKNRLGMTVSQIFGYYYQTCLLMYRNQKMQEPDSWKTDLDREFLNGYHRSQEMIHVRRSEPLYDFLTPEEADVVRAVVDNYFEFIKTKEDALAQDQGNPTEKKQQKEIREEDSCEGRGYGLRISEDRITDVIKTIWSMHDVGMFVDQDGNRPTVKSVMDAFAEFLQAKQLEQYSVYMNKGLRATKNTYLDVFCQMEESAEKHYDKQKNRKIDK